MKNMLTPEESARQTFDNWYAAAASFTGPTSRRTCVEAFASAIRAATQEVLEVLRIAQEDVCSLHCPSVKKTGEEWTHSERCRAISEVIAKTEVAKS